MTPPSVAAVAAEEEVGEAASVEAEVGLAEEAVVVSTAAVVEVVLVGAAGEASAAAAHGRRLVARRRSAIPVVAEEEYVRQCRALGPAPELVRGRMLAAATLVQGIDRQYSPARDRMLGPESVLDRVPRHYLAIGRGLDRDRELVPGKASRIDPVEQRSTTTESGSRSSRLVCLD